MNMKSVTAATVTTTVNTNTTNTVTVNNTVTTPTTTAPMLNALARAAFDVATAEWESVKQEISEECRKEGFPDHGTEWGSRCIEEWERYFGPTLEWLDEMVTGEIPVDREEVVGLLACN